jgi:16S rRNA (guanine527-N7)-methyltransferase
MNLDAELSEGLTGLGINLSDGARARLLAYVNLLQKWNRTYNLTAVRDPVKMVSHHLLDCLAVLPHVRAHALADIGSGAGLPGIPLAIALPALQVTLVESNQKKAAFLRQAKLELKLDNLHIACDRVERWQPQDKFDVVIARALTDLPELIALAGRHVKDRGYLVAMKGAFPHEEIARLPGDWRVSQVHALAVPGLVGERHLVVLERA